MTALTSPETGGPECTRPCIPAPEAINEAKPSPGTTTRQLNPFVTTSRAHLHLASRPDLRRHQLSYRANPPNPPPLPQRQSVTPNSPPKPGPHKANPLLFYPLSAIKVVNHWISMIFQKHSIPLIPSIPILITPNIIVLWWKKSKGGQEHIYWAKIRFIHFRSISTPVAIKKGLAIIKVIKKGE